MQVEAAARSLQEAINSLQEVDHTTQIDKSELSAVAQLGRTLTQIVSDLNPSDTEAPETPTPDDQSAYIRELEKLLEEERETRKSIESYAEKLQTDATEKINSLRSRKARLDDKVTQAAEQQRLLIKEVKSLRSRISDLEENTNRLTESNVRLEDCVVSLCQVLQRNIDGISCESERLIAETTIQKSNDCLNTASKARQFMVSDVGSEEVSNPVPPEAGDLCDEQISENSKPSLPPDVPTVNTTRGTLLDVWSLPTGEPDTSATTTYMVPTCFRCGGTVEGPKYSTCRCNLPLLSPPVEGEDRINEESRPIRGLLKHAAGGLSDGIRPLLSGSFFSKKEGTSGRSHSGDSNAPTRRGTFKDIQLPIDIGTATGNWLNSATSTLSKENDDIASQRRRRNSTQNQLPILFDVDAVGDKSVDDVVVPESHVGPNIVESDDSTKSVDLHNRIDDIDKNDTVGQQDDDMSSNTD